jgi:hypothetical protein
MSRRLRTELTAYQMAMLDDSFQESPHGIITAIVRRAPSSLDSWWSANFRLRQNLALRKVMDREHPGRFADLFKHWRSLFSRKPTGRKLRHCRGFIRKDFLKKVYRMDEYAFHNLNTMKKFQTSFQQLSAEAIADVSSEGKIMQEYVQMILKPDIVYSIMDDDMAIANPAPPASSGTEICADIADPPLTFQVVSLQTKSLKTIRTADGRAEQALRAPVMISRLTFFNYSCNPLSDHFVFPVGDPEVIDLMAATSPAHVLKRLKNIIQWKNNADSEVAGTMHIQEPQRVCDRVWFSYLKQCAI